MSSPQRRLDQVCTVIMGQAPQGAAYNTAGKGWPLIAGAGDFIGEAPVAKKFTTQASKLSRPGDIVLGIRASIGAKVWADDVYCLGRGVAGLRPGPDLAPNYLWHWLSDNATALAAKGKGATFKQVNRQDICEMQIAVPPLEEQGRIAAILDQADALRAKRREALSHLDDLTQSIFLDMFGDPVANHFSWPREPLSSLLTSIDSGQSPVCLARAAEPDEWAVLKLGAVTYGRFDASANKALPPGFAPRPELEVKPGDLLFTRKNTADLVGATALVGVTRPKLLLPDLIFRLNFRDSAEVHKDYLHCLLMWPSKRKKIQGLANGSAGSMPNISKAKLRNVPIELPPMRVQQKFAERVAGLERARLALQEQVVGFNQLFSALQAQAFVGDV